MNDLITKESALALFDQKDMIHGNLTLLQDNYDASLPASIILHSASCADLQSLGLLQRSSGHHHNRVLH